MPMFFIHATNSEFRSSDDGGEYDQPEDALASGVRGAIPLLAEEINRGERSAAVEISVHGEDGTQILRSVVAVSVSSLISTVA